MEESCNDWSVSVRHDIDWSKVDPKAINDAYQKFWCNTEVKRFERDKDGKLVAIRTDIQRMRPKSTFDNFENLTRIV